MDPRRPTDSPYPESSQHPSSASPPQLMSESDSALIPRPSSPASRKRDLQYRIQHHANSPVQRDDEKRVRPEPYLALTAPESNISDDSMDPLSSSEDLTMSDETALAIACSAPLPEGDDDLFLSDSSALPLALTDGGAILAESTQEIIRYEASDSSTVATQSAIVERTIVTRSMTANPRRAIVGPSPLELHIPRTLVTEQSIVTQTQHVRPTSNLQLEQGHPTQLLTNVQVQHDTVDNVPTQTFLGIQPTVRSNDQVNVYDPVLLTHDQSMNAQRPLPSSAPSQMTDPSSNHELVPSDVEMENETPETALTLVTNFSVQLQSLQTQVDSSSVMFNSLNDRLNLALQTSQSQHEMTATSMNSLSISLHELSDRTNQVQ
ncbi:hypothetical protein AeMF1_020711, partial [Aphanomyces euteiches]